MQITPTTDNQLDIQSIVSRLTAAEQLVRDSVMEQIIDRGGPVTAIDLEHLETLHNLDVDEKLAALLKKQTIVVNPDGLITFSYPVSALPTNHRVTLADGRCFHAMCAVDAMGTAFTFNQDIKVDSLCSYCRQPVHLEVVGQELIDLQPTETHVLHVDLNRYDNWSGNCWNIMNFFCTKKHYEAWLEQMNVSQKHFCLPAAEALKVAQMLFGR